MVRRLLAVVTVLVAAFACGSDSVLAQAPLHKLLVLSGDSAPGGGTYLGFGEVATARVDSAVFNGYVSTGEDVRMGIWQGELGKMSLVADARTTAPGTGGLFRAFTVPVASPSGAVAFNGFATDDFLHGTWLSGGGSIQALAIEGKTVPSLADLKFGTVGRPAINAKREVAFKAQLYEGLRLEGDLESGAVMVFRNGAVTAAVKEGDVLPGSGGYLIRKLFGDDGYPGTKVDMNDAGQLLFTAELGDAESDYYSWDALLLGKPDALTIAAETGVPAPGLPGTFMSRIRESAVNNAGEVAFVAEYYSYGGEAFESGYGSSVFAGAPGAIVPIVSEGDVIPKSGGLTFGTIEDVDLNDLGDVVFEADIVYSNGRTRRGLWLKTQREPIRLLVAEGNHLPTGVGTSDLVTSLRFRGSGAFNEFGQAAFIAELGQSERSGVYLANTYFVAPGLRLLQPTRRGQVTDEDFLVLRGVATSQMELTRVEVTAQPVGNERAVKRSGKTVRVARGGDERTLWSAKVPLQMGRNRITIRVLDVLGNDSGTMMFDVMRYDSGQGRPQIRPSRPKLKKKA